MISSMSVGVTKRAKNVTRLDFLYPLTLAIDMPHIYKEHISIGCNRTAHAASWGLNGLVAFGANQLIALYNPLVNDLQPGSWFTMSLTSLSIGQA